MPPQSGAGHGEWGASCVRGPEWSRLFRSTWALAPAGLRSCSHRGTALGSLLALLLPPGPFPSWPPARSLRLLALTCTHVVWHLLLSCWHSRMVQAGTSQPVPGAACSEAGACCRRAPTPGLIPGLLASFKQRALRRAYAAAVAACLPLGAQRVERPSSHPQVSRTAAGWCQARVP